MKFIKVSIVSIIFFLSHTSVYAGSNDLLHFEFNVTKTTSFLHPPYISGVIGDATDPAFTKGIVVSITENNKTIAANDYQIKAISSNAIVVAETDVMIEKNNNEATIKIKPSTVGYSNITLVLTKGKEREELIIYYAASATNKNLQTLWHTGFSDASAAIAIDDKYMIVGDDENNVLAVYDRTQSGLPITTFNYEKYLHSGEESSREIDCEAVARSPKNPHLIYWTGSMGNGGKKFEEKPNRSTLIATEFNGTGKDVHFDFKDSYTELRKNLIKWGNANGYNFSASAASGEKPKQINGFNIEGMVFGPDSTTLYIAFRAPIVPITERKKALIAPIKNFEDWFTKEHHHSKKIIIDKPIELDLDGRAFREIIQLSNSKYLIVAGNSTAVKNAAIYLWSGFASDAPKLISDNSIKDLNIEAAVEILDNGQYTGKVQLLCDDGATDFYNDAISSKYLHNGFKKFRSITFLIQAN